MSTIFTVDTERTLEVRKKLAADNIVLYSALEEAEKKAVWLAYYQQLTALEDSSSVMDIAIPE